MKPLLLLLILLQIFFVSPLLANPDPDDSGGKRMTISGYISDKKTGEELIGATVYINEIKTGTTTNVYGFYSISLVPGSYTILYSYIGYAGVEKSIELKENITLNIELNTRETRLKEVVITADRPDENIRKPEMSVVKMDIKTINRIPALMGEVDLIKAIQMLPGVQSTAEGSSGFSVRGGSPDQNLILLDEAIVYNASHLLGFFSVFNNDAIK
ncbi:MAG: TonB-dependent receptor, partial [Lentimicrobium sp.]|nr:TonB-dependent receptor [Lentimicrobium sp.]